VAEATPWPNDGPWGGSATPKGQTIIIIIIYFIFKLIWLLGVADPPPRAIGVADLIYFIVDNEYILDPYINGQHPPFMNKIAYNL
jgi:hypothetical protein